MSALLALACESPTQFIVVVDSDIGELSRVHAASSSDGEYDEHDFAIEETGIPFSFGLSRGPGDGDVVRITLDGFADGQAHAFVTRTIETRFLPGEVRQIHVSLNRNCSNVTEDLGCTDAGMTCLDGACVALVVDPRMFPEGVPDVSPRRVDAGPRPDAGTTEDAGGCVNGAACADPANPCRTGDWFCDSDEPICMIDTTLPEGTSCGSGRVCDAEGLCAM